MKNLAVHYWEKIGDSYNSVWKGDAREMMSKKEMGFITKYLNKIKPKKVLDIGFGTGRILETHCQSLQKGAEIYGVDISPKMVELCRRRFKNEKRIKLLKAGNIDLVLNGFSGKFDFITAIRVIKYNRNWREILNDLYKKLAPGGILIFTMPNRFSINRWAKTTFPIERSTEGELSKLLNKIGFEILEITGFSRLPDIFYDLRLKNNMYYVSLLDKVEKILGLIFGMTLFNRGLFLATKKKL